MIPSGPTWLPSAYVLYFSHKLLRGLNFHSVILGCRPGDGGSLDGEAFGVADRALSAR